MRTLLAASTTLCAGLTMMLSSTAQAQNLFVGDGREFVIYELTPSGAKSTFASGLHNVAGLAFDSSNNLFVADNDGNISGNIYKFTPNGASSTFASGTTGANGLAFDTAGNLFVGNYGNGTIYKYTPGGVPSTFATGLGNGPVGLAFDNAGNLFVSDAGSGDIYEYTPGGVQSIFATNLFEAGGLAFNSAGNLFAGDGSGHIYEYTPAGVRSVFASGMSRPYGLAFDGHGNLYAADFSGGRVYKFTPNGSSNVFASGFLSPDYIAFPVLDTNAFRVLAITPQQSDALITWTMVPGATNALQAASGDANGNYSSNGFTDIFIVTNIAIVGTVTNFLDAGALTNNHTRYYRARWGP
jgi:sugar lactone lactonase YvrE